MRRFANIHSIITNNHKGQYLQKLTKIIYHNTQIITLKRINPKRERNYKLWQSLNILWDILQIFTQLLLTITKA